MNILYKSTRGDGSLVTASQAILEGLSKDGGLFVPTEIPALELDLEAAAEMDYKELAFHILRSFLSDFTDEELKNCIENAYDSKFDTEEIVPLVKKDGKYFLELFHGATIAFKDMALSILPHLLTTAARKNNITNDIVILTATSGDTGKAALAGFADVPGTKIVVFYPDGGVSNIQRLQMVTQKGDNTCVIAVKGNFDDCQREVKNMFNDRELAQEMEEKGYQFSSANSINIGRLIPQVVYYVWAYTRLIKRGAIKCGDKIDFVVPTGNFGNILAGYYAKLMGLPVNKFICASNDNKVLFDFFRTGTYDKNREFILTNSPSMDILVSSNLERLIYRITGESEEQTRTFMEQLATEGKYSITNEMREGLSDFVGVYAGDAESISEIKRLYDTSDYIMDTHTAVAACGYEKYKAETGDDTPVVIVSTASPFKFLKPVLSAIDPDHVDKLSIWDLVWRLDELRGKQGLPQAIKDIMALPIRHKTVCDIENMEDEVKKFLNV